MHDEIVPVKKKGGMSDVVGIARKEKFRGNRV